MYLGFSCTITRQSICQIFLMRKLNLNIMTSYSLLFKNTLILSKEIYQFPYEFVSWLINKGKTQVSYLLWLRCGGAFLTHTVRGLDYHEWALKEYCLETIIIVPILSPDALMQGKYTWVILAGNYSPHRTTKWKAPGALEWQALLNKHTDHF